MANHDMTDSSRNPNLPPRSARRPNLPAQPLSDQNGVDSQHLQTNNADSTMNQNLPGQVMNRNLTEQQRLELNQNEQHSIPVVEESLQVGKREVERGGVRVQSKIVERPVDEQINLREEHVHVERKPVNRPVAPGDMAAFREGTIELHERAEEAVVAKQARVVEEVIVGKEVNQRTQQIHETLRHTEVSIDRLGGTMKTTAYKPFESFDTDFRQDWTTNYARLGGTYDSYAPLYRYGYNLATSRQFSGKDWSAIESDARGAWEEKNPNTWDRVKAAVRNGWDRVTNKS